MDLKVGVGGHQFASKTIDFFTPPPPSPSVKWVGQKYIKINREEETDSK